MSSTRSLPLASKELADAIFWSVLDLLTCSDLVPLYATSKWMSQAVARYLRDVRRSADVGSFGVADFRFVWQSCSPFSVAHICCKLKTLQVAANRWNDAPKSLSQFVVRIIFQNHATLEKFSAPDTRFGEDVMLALATCPRLTCLRIKDLSATDAALAHFAELIGERLVELDLSVKHREDTSTTASTLLRAGLPRLQVLKAVLLDWPLLLTGCPNLTSLHAELKRKEDLLPFAETVPLLPHLTELSFTFPSYHDKMASVRARRPGLVWHFPRLQDLYIRCVPLRIFPPLVAPELETLRASVLIADVLELLPNCPRLEDLKDWSHGKKPPGTTRFRDNIAFRWPQTLRELRLDGLGDPVPVPLLIAVAEQCKALTSLEAVVPEGQCSLMLVRFLLEALPCLERMEVIDDWRFE